MKRRVYYGYPLSRIVAGIVRIQRRHAGRLETAGLSIGAELMARIMDAESEDMRWYLLTFGFNSVDEFRGFLARRTSDAFAARLIDGYTSFAWERRDLARRKSA